MQTQPNLRIVIWLPAVFAAFLSMMRLFLPDASGPAFYSFLPMCFFFVGISQLALLKKLESMESAAAERE